MPFIIVFGIQLSKSGPPILKAENPFAAAFMERNRISGENGAQAVYISGYADLFVICLAATILHELGVLRFFTMLASPVLKAFGAPKKLRPVLSSQ